jgi:hypothetical protein
MPLSLKASTSRQYVMSAEITLLFSDVQSAVGTGVAELFRVQDGTRIIGGVIVVETLFATAGTATIDLGDGVDPNRYTASPVDLETAGLTAITLTGFKYTAEDTIDATVVVGTAATTAGQVYVRIDYVEDDKAHEQVPFAIADYDPARADV